MSSGTHRFLVQLAGSTEQSVALDGPALIIGREPPLGGLRLDHPLVARQHAEIRAEGVKLTITDLQSRNGTWVNEVRLLPNQPQLLSSGDAIRIAPYMLIYTVDLGDQFAARSPVDTAATAPPAYVELLASVELLPLAVREAVLPAPLPDRVSTYLGDMPVLYHDDDFLGRFLLGFEWVWEALEQRQMHLPLYFDPATCPACMLPWLAGWFDLRLEPRWTEGTVRRVLTEAMSLLDGRGTRGGLTRVIELISGRTPYIVEDPALPFVFHMVVAAPEGDRPLIERLIQQYKPAHIGYTLELRQ